MDTQPVYFWSSFSQELKPGITIYNVNGMRIGILPQTVIFLRRLYDEMGLEIRDEVPPCIDQSKMGVCKGGIVQSHT